MTSPRTCVLGSSFIGAVYAAYKLATQVREAHAVDFFGRAHGGFASVDIADGQFTNLGFRSVTPSPDIFQYTAFVVYADLPSPHAVHLLLQDCARAGYSQQVAQALVYDTVQKTATMRLCRNLANLTGKPVSVLSANVPAHSKMSIAPKRYVRSVKLIEQAVAGAAYIAFPPQIFDENYVPRSEFYRDALLIGGEKARSAKVDYQHMNEAGGLAVLQAIIASISTPF